MLNTPLMTPHRSPLKYIVVYLLLVIGTVLGYLGWQTLSTPTPAYTGALLLSLSLFAGLSTVLRYGVIARSQSNSTSVHNLMQNA